MSLNGDLQRRLSLFVVQPNTWLNSGESALHCRRTLDAVLPMSQFKQELFTQDAASRLLLLDHTEWLTLGFGVALLPYAGSLETTLDGRLRRAVQSRFSEQQIRQLDAMGPIDPSPDFLLSRTAWENPDQVAHSGIANITALVPWNDTQRQLMALRFETTPLAISSLTPTQIEELCKILLPNLSWL